MVKQSIPHYSITPKSFHLALVNISSWFHFEGNYSNRDEIKLVTAEPLVLNFTAADNQQLVLDYKKPRNEVEAKQFPEGSESHAERQSHRPESEQRTVCDA